MTKKNYELYRVIKSQEGYFSTWTNDSLESLTPNLKAEIYARYIVKCSVLQRDEFKCRNENCEYPDSKLTIHHIKFKKNNGEDKMKNCVTICKTCHQAFHRGKGTLTFDNATYQIHKGEEKVNWKKIRAQGKELRKNKKEFHGIRVSWELICILMKFLEIPFYELNDGDDD
uniref:HNH nuclease domain-containing protein n=1 Tax=viral metagenome TaxID=1070528 RepID=A0A6C0EMY9_9ZZZZ